MFRTALVFGLFLLAVACGSPKPLCNATNCANGCCDAVTGQCQSGSFQTACGSAGLTCKVCDLGQICSLGTCSTFGATGGGFASTGGGTSGTGGGSSATGGGSGATGGGSSATGGGSTSTGGGGTTSTGGGSANTGGGTGSSGETCATAQTWNIGQALTGTTAGYQDDLSTLCSSSGSPDRMYGFSVATAGRLIATYSGTGYTPLVSVFKSDCLSQVDCGNAGSLVTHLEAGSYYLVVESPSSTPGSFLVESSFAAPPGDTCSSAEPLVFSGSTATANGTTEGYGNEFASTSCGSSGADHVYSFTIASSSLVTAQVSGVGFSPLLSLRGPTTVPSSCATATEQNCSDTGQLNATLTAGTYYLIVDGTTGAEGSYTLTVTRTASGGTGDTCSAPLPITLSGGTASIAGSLTGAANDNASSACTAAGNDVVYSLVLSQTSAVTATLTASAFTPTLVIRGASATCSAANETNCANVLGTNATVTTTLAAGTYYLWVDSVNTTATGAFTLDVTANAVTNGTGQSCTGPALLTVTGTTTVVNSTTVGAVNNSKSATCGGGLSDVVYQFTLASAKTLNATVSTTTATYRPVIYVTTSCPGTELDCAYATAEGGTTSMTTALDAGTYFLWVDSYNTTGVTTDGAFKLSVYAQ